MAAMDILVRDGTSHPASRGEALLWGSVGVALVLGLVMLAAFSLRAEPVQVVSTEPAIAQRAVVPLMPDLPELP
jgi:hypothetical protein